MTRSERTTSERRQRWFVRVSALTIWGYLVWLVLTWTATVEQQVFGVGLALASALLMAPLGNVVPPWRLLDPRRLLGIIRLMASALVRIVQANVNLSRRIWAPSRPLHSGMVIVPTRERSDAGLAGTGLISSLVVDNQIVDLDRVHNELQYHAIAVPHGNRAHPEDDINAPIERLLDPLESKR